MKSGAVKIAGVILGICLIIGGGSVVGCKSPFSAGDSGIDTVGGADTTTVVVDTALQKMQNDYIAMKFGMFIHFSMSTFSPSSYNDNTPRGEWEKGGEADTMFHPGSLDCGQWADVAKNAHCKYVVLTTKHHGGFCLWPSNCFSAGRPHSIRQAASWSGYQTRDIVKEFVDSVRSRGLEPGFYYSVWDKTNPPTIAQVLGQLRELLTGYGDIKCIWFDGWGWQVGYGTIPYDTVAQLVHHLNDSLHHHTIIIEQNHKYKLYKTELVEYEVPIDGPPNAANTLPSEGNEPLRSDNCWFWHPVDNCNLKAVTGTNGVVTKLAAANAAHASYLLDVTPDTSGRIPACQVQRMKEIGDEAVSRGLLP
jgi:hypothetical protein